MRGGIAMGYGGGDCKERGGMGGMKGLWGGENWDWGGGVYVVFWGGLGWS